MVDARGIIGNYIVERELGRGGMGVVYAAKHRVLGRPAAIKLLLASTSDDRGRVERFFNEARAAMAIDHPGIVKIYDVGIAADDRPYIAMELLDGTALAHHIAPSGLPIRQAVEYACQIASALAAAHDAGVIHRDLKPENIIISRDRSRAIVVDFGVAKLSQQATVRTATGALVGTPLYMSPEQCEGLRELDARSDLYAFGCVIFAMLTGRPPFFEGGTGGLIGMHLHVAPPLLRSRCANASEALERIVSVLLAKSPDARFRTARAALAALQAPEVRGLAATPGSAATADVVPGSGSVQPWSATPAIVAPPVARDAQTMGTGIATHASGAHAGASHAATGWHAGNAGSMPPHASGSHAGTSHGGPMAPHASGSHAGHAGSMAPHASGSHAGHAGVATPSTAFGVPASREAWTQVTGIDHRDPRTAAVQAVGTPSPSSVVTAHPPPSTPSHPSPLHSAPTPGHTAGVSPSTPYPGAHSSSSVAPHTDAPPGHAHSHAVSSPGDAPSPTAPAPSTNQRSRRTLIVAIVASCALTAIIAVGATRGCGGRDGSIDAGVAIGSGSGHLANGSNLAAAGSNAIANAPLDAAVTLDAAVIATQEPRSGDPRMKDPRPDSPNVTAQPKGTPQPRSTTQPKGTTPARTKTPAGSVQIAPNDPPLGERPTNEVPGANAPDIQQPERPPPEIVRKEIRESMTFAKGDSQATLGQRVLDRVAAHHRADPNRRIVITAYAEKDEPGVLATLAENRLNMAYKQLLERGVAKSILVVNTTLVMAQTDNGTNRRVTFEFE